MMRTWSSLKVVRGRFRLAVSLSVLFTLAWPVPFAAATSYEYDSAGRLSRVTTNLGTVIAYTYDAAGNRSQLVLEAHADANANGVADIYDDEDGDGIPYAVEGGVDTDGDGSDDALDLDSDNDGRRGRHQPLRLCEQQSHQLHRSLGIVGERQRRGGVGHVSAGRARLCGGTG